MAKVVLITGASAGIGLATAERLQRAGWVVVGASRRGTCTPGWTGLVMDVDDDASVSAGVAHVLDEHGRIDAVVLSAGWGLAGAFEQTGMAEAKAQLDTNFFGSVRVLQALLPSMRAGGGGRVVFVSSIGGIVSIPFQAFYSASKFAIEGVAEALAYEVAPFGVSVTLVEPGNVRTDFTASRQTLVGQDDPVYAEALAHAIGVMERDEANGVGADVVAVTIQRVLDARRPPRRVSVGKWSERIGIWAKRGLPFRLFEAAAKGSLGVR